MCEEKLNIVGLKYLKERAFREVGGGNTYLHDKYTMASLLEMEWWKAAAHEGGNVIAEPFVSGIVCVDIHPGPQNPSSFKMAFYVGAASEARARVYFTVNGYTRMLHGWAPFGLRV